MELNRNASEKRSGFAWKQERSLSSKTLHFRTYSLPWHCECP